jgi:hypothetical protein
MTFPSADSIFLTLMFAVIAFIFLQVWKALSFVMGSLKTINGRLDNLEKRRG